MLRFRLLLAAVAFGMAGKALAYCDGGRYPNLPLASEVKASEFVVIGKLDSYRRVVDPSDPEGYEATLYRVRVEQVLSGRLPGYVRKSHLTIYNENTSARFPFDDSVHAGAGKRYLLLVRAGPDGYWVDACGHSGELDASRETLNRIRSLAAARKHAR
jgi:hypothetical protein